MRAHQSPPDSGYSLADEALGLGPSYGCSTHPTPTILYGAYQHIDGWSEAVIDYVREFEKISVDSSD